MAKPIVVMGDINVDMLLKGADLEGRPPFGLEVRGGGTSANTAVALAHLGLPVEFLGAVGDDGFGRFLRQDLMNEGVGASHVQAKAGMSSLLIIFALNDAGDILFGAPAWPRDLGELATGLHPDEIDLALIAGAGWIHASGTNFIIPSFREGTLRALEAAHDAGVPVSIDLNFRPMGQQESFWELIHRGLEMADVVLGSATDDWPELVPNVPFVEAARRVSAGRRICVARMGAQGSMAVSPEWEMRVEVFPVDVVDAVGAGDTYNAGFIAARLEGLSLGASLRMGSAVAAITISRVGTRSSPTRAEVNALLTGERH